MDIHLVLKADVINLIIALQPDISYGYYKQMKRYKTAKL